MGFDKRRGAPRADEPAVQNGTQLVNVSFGQCVRFAAGELLVMNDEIVTQAIEGQHVQRHRFG